MPEKPEKLRLGGMALRNGLLVHGPTHWAAAVRTADGTIAVASGPKPRLRGPALRIAGVRGVAPPRRGDGRDPARQARAARGAPALPGRHGRPGDGRDGGRRRWRCAAARAGSAGRRRSPRSRWRRRSSPCAVGDLAAYHGVEHKAIGAYEQDGVDARDASKEHDRCGSHLMAPLLAANLAGTALLRRTVERPSPLAGAAVQLASIGVAVEVFAWSERTRRHRAGARAAPAGPRAAARARHPRADRGPARGGPRRPGGDPARRTNALATAGCRIATGCRYRCRGTCIDPARGGRDRRRRGTPTCP